VNLANMANDKLYRNCRSSGLHCSWFYAVFNSQDHHCRTVDLYSAAPSLSLQKHYTPWAIKTWHFNFVHHLRQLLTDFQNFLTTTLCKQFAYHVKPTQLNPHSLVSYRPFTVMLGWSVFFLISPKCLFVIIVIFIDISQGNIETHLRSGGIIANCLQSVPVKKFWKSINSWRRYGQKWSATFWTTLYKTVVKTRSITTSCLHTYPSCYAEYGADDADGFRRKTAF